MNMNFSPSTKKGNIGVASVILEALQKNYVVSIPFEGAPYDLILEKDGVLNRVQVKYSKPRKGILTVYLSKGYSKVNIDVIIAYNPDTRGFYWIPVEAVNGNVGGFSLRLTGETKNNQNIKVNWAKDYEWGAII